MRVRNVGNPFARRLDRADRLVLDPDIESFWLHAMDPRKLFGPDQKMSL